MKIRGSKRHSSQMKARASRWWIMPVLLACVLAAVVAWGGKHWPVKAAENRLVIAMGGTDGDGNDCTSPDMPCATIQYALSQSSAGDLIVLGPGTYFENVTVGVDVTIQGDGTTGSIIDGGAAASVVTISPGVTSTLNQVTITNGNAQAGSGFEGGGISNNGTLTIIGSTINGNQAVSAPGDGGGIANIGGALTIINSTISGNFAQNGGGIFNSEGTTTIVNSTINGNSAPAGGGILNEASSTLNLTNTIIAGSLGGGDCSNSGTLGTNLNNLIQDGSCSPTVSGDPKLGPLQNNGGPTATHELLVGSPAINAGDDSVLGSPLFLETDQRGPGFPRLVCTHVDIGAFEFGGGIPPTINCPGDISTFAPTGQSTVSVTFTVTASDMCDGPLTPTCTAGGTPITSPFDFPLGMTTVTCSATNSLGAMAMCSFTVNVVPLNMCIQDDRTGDTLQFNSQTGSYTYTRCRDGFTLSGTGSVFSFSGISMLSDSKPDRRLSAGFNIGQLTGRATITLILAPGIFQTITLNQTNPHATCVCAT